MEAIKKEMKKKQWTNEERKKKILYIEKINLKLKKKDTLSINKGRIGVEKGMKDYESKQSTYQREGK